MTKRIPISCAKKIAEQYGYQQVLIYARDPIGTGNEHMTTYGTSKELCSAMAVFAKQLQKHLGWTGECAK